MARSRIGKCSILLILMLALVPTVSAHTPLKPGEENTSLERALEIPNPTKSWTLYRELHEAGETEYYKLQLDPGERLRISLYTPTTENPNFAPNLVVMGPDIASEDILPEFVEVPDGFGFVIIETDRPEKPEYEPFTPTSYYYLVDFDMEISTGGTYYFAVYETAREGRYGVALGYKEEFTLLEWVKIPLDVISIHLWEGQHLGLILAPMLATLVIGFGLLIWKYGLDLNAFNLVGSTAGLLYLGSGFMILMQMIISLMGAKYDSLVILTIIFTLLPFLLGFALLRKVGRGRSALSIRDRVIFVLLGVLGLFSWAGLLLGPALAMVASILPSGDSREPVGEG